MPQAFRELPLEFSGADLRLVKVAISLKHSSPETGTWALSPRKLFRILYQQMRVTQRRNIQSNDGKGFLSYPRLS